MRTALPSSVTRSVGLLGEVRVSVWEGLRS